MWTVKLFCSFYNGLVCLCVCVCVCVCVGKTRFLRLKEKHWLWFIENKLLTKISNTIHEKETEDGENYVTTEFMTAVPHQTLIE